MKNQNSNQGVEISKLTRKKKKRLGFRVNKGDVGMAVLAAVGMAGVLAAVMVAPGLAQVFGMVKQISHSSRRRYRSPAYARKVVSSLHRKGLVFVFDRNGEQYIRLTSKGKKALLSRQIRAKKGIFGRWDKKWRIIIFDIPEKKKYLRDRIRENIVSVGFVQLQESVWVYPYECEELVTLLKAECALGKEVLYIVAEDVEGDHLVRKHFGLPAKPKIS